MTFAPHYLYVCTHDTMHSVSSSSIIWRMCASCTKDSFRISNFATKEDVQRIFVLETSWWSISLLYGVLSLSVFFLLLSLSFFPSLALLFFLFFEWWFPIYCQLAVTYVSHTCRTRYIRHIKSTSMDTMTLFAFSQVFWPIPTHHSQRCDFNGVWLARFSHRFHLCFCFTNTIVCTCICASRPNYAYNAWYLMYIRMDLSAWMYATLVSSKSHRKQGPFSLCLLDLSYPKNATLPYAAFRYHQIRWRWSSWSTSETTAPWLLSLLDVTVRVHYDQDVNLPFTSPWNLCYYRFMHYIDYYWVYYQRRCRYCYYYYSYSYYLLIYSLLSSGLSEGVGENQETHHRHQRTETQSRSAEENGRDSTYHRVRSSSCIRFLRFCTPPLYMPVLVSCWHYSSVYLLLFPRILILRLFNSDERADGDGDGDADSSTSLHQLLAEGPMLEA